MPCWCQPNLLGRGEASNLTGRYATPVSVVFPAEASIIRPMDPRRQAVLITIGALALIWTVAIAGQYAFKASVVTAEKVGAYVAKTDLDTLKGEDRARALRGLANRINTLTMPDRKKARQARAWDRWFSQMTEEEKLAFIDATLPAGFKQMMSSLQKLPPERLAQVINNAFRRLRESPENPNDPYGFNGQVQAVPNLPTIAETLRAQVLAMGFINVYTSGSAQTKAELAPLWEELLGAFQSGRMFGGRPH